MHKSSRLRGFTLVELLVVIGIIALLISILLPAMNRVREKGNQTKCLSNLRQLATAFRMYANEYKDWYPAGSRYPDASMKWEDWFWYQEKPVGTVRPIADPALSPICKYIGGFRAELFRCPSDDVESHTNTWVATNPQYKYSYSFNSNFESSLAINNRVRVSRIKRSSEKILLVEEDERTINDGLWSPGNGINTNAGKDLLAIRHDLHKNPNDPIDQVVSTNPNRDKKGNAAFVDGHAEYITRLYAHDILHLDKN